MSPLISCVCYEQSQPSAVFGSSTGNHCFPTVFCIIHMDTFCQRCESLATKPSEQSWKWDEDIVSDFSPWPQMSFKGHFCYKYSEIRICGISSGSVCRGACGKLAFPCHLAELGNWFCFASTTAKGSFLVKALCDSSVLVKQRTWRGKTSYTDQARGFKCSCRGLTGLCK